MPTLTEQPPAETSGALFHALHSVNVEAGLAYRADEEMRAQAGQNVIAVVNARSAESSAADKEFRAVVDARFAELSAENKEFRAVVDARSGEINARFEAIDTRFDAIQRELSLLRWMVGVGFTLISTFLAISTILSR